MKEIHIPGIPMALADNPMNGKIAISGTTIEISANKGTDLFVSPDGSESNDNSPRLFFTPQDDFIFSSKISVEFNTSFDGAALLIYGDSKNWGKLLFEQFDSGEIGISTTVTKETGDDVYHRTEKLTSIFFKITRTKDTYTFYDSKDGEVWNFLRIFQLKSSSPIVVGFTAQSPLGENLSAEFSEIRFESKTVSDFWQGK